jgi:hypothetical protein
VRWALQSEVYILEVSTDIFQPGDTLKIGLPSTDRKFLVLATGPGCVAVREYRWWDGIRHWPRRSLRFVKRLLPFK